MPAFFASATAVLAVSRLCPRGRDLCAPTGDPQGDSGQPLRDPPGTYPKGSPGTPPGPLGLHGFRKVQMGCPGFLGFPEWAFEGSWRFVKVPRRLYIKK